MSRNKSLTSSLADLAPRLVLLPSVLLIFVGVYMFIAWTGWISLSSSKLTPNYDFVGLSQYVRLWSTPRWHTAVINLFLFSSLFLARSIGISTLGALLSMPGAASGAMSTALPESANVFGSNFCATSVVPRRNTR